VALKIENTLITDINVIKNTERPFFGTEGGRGREDETTTTFLQTKGWEVGNKKHLKGQSHPFLVSL